MSLIRRRWLLAGVAVLTAVWAWPLPGAPLPAFSRHMIMHMAVVTVAAPLLAWSVAGTPLDPARRWPSTFSAIPASVAELVIVWGWHAPALHHAARHQTIAFIVEQSTFLTAGFALWVAAIGGTPRERRQRALAGVAGLLLTSMHMTLLGALIALTPRVLYHHTPSGSALPPLEDQQLGGAIMLVVGGVAYLAGGLILTAKDLLARAHSGSQP